MLRTGSRRCVVVDVGGVLEMTPATGWTERWEQELGLPGGALMARLSHVLRAGALGQATEDEVVAAVAERLGLSRSERDAFWADVWAEYLGTLNVPLFDWFRSLRPRFRTGILTNSFVGAREREQERYGFADAADVLVYSHEVGVGKPDPRVYRLTAERLGAAPADIVFLDDVPACVEAARDAGWRAVVFEDNAQAIAELEALLR